MKVEKHVGLKLTAIASFGKEALQNIVCFSIEANELESTENLSDPDAHQQTHARDKGGQMNHNMTHILHDKNIFLPSGYTYKSLECKISRVKFNLSLHLPFEQLHWIGQGYDLILY